MGFQRLSLFLLSSLAIPFVPAVVVAESSPTSAGCDVAVAERKTVNDLTRENDKLREHCSSVDASMAELQNNLSASFTEIEVLKRKLSELRLRFEAIGLDSTSDGKRIEQKFLKVLGDLQACEVDRLNLREALSNLYDVAFPVQVCLSSNEPEIQLALLLGLRKASKALQHSPWAASDAVSISGTPSEASVIAVREDIALVVADIGRNRGVKMGMPFNVFRGPTKIGTIRVVDVREKFAGAIIQDVSSDLGRIGIGDRLHIATGY